MSFYGDWCGSCKKLDVRVLIDPDPRGLVKEISVSITPEEIKRRIKK